MANICRGLRKKNFFSPVLKSPTHIGFIGVKKMGQKSHTWAPLKVEIEEGISDKQTYFYEYQRIKNPVIKKTSRVSSLQYM
jgi:hypothetical protein